LGDGKTQLLFFNFDPTQAEGGAIRIQEFDLQTRSFVTRFQENWSVLRTVGMSGWLDPNDRLVAGNFLAWEGDQLLFINTDPNHSGGAMRILEFDWALNGFITRFWKEWSAIPPGTYNGWLDPNDHILSIGSQPEFQ
jgi:hypothetical protein